MAKVVRTERFRRGVFGHIMKWSFIGFNLLMAIWLVSGLSAVSRMSVHGDAERVGQAIGATLGVSMLIAMWLFGTLILGLLVLLTRGRKEIVEETLSGGASWSAAASNDGNPSIDQKIAAALAERAPVKPSIPAAAGANSLGGSAPSFGKRR